MRGVRQVKDEVFARTDQLSPAERKVARALLADYPSAGLGSAASLAKAAGTSTPTVLRLLGRLGIGSYPEFQELLRQEISQATNSPLARASGSLRPGETTFLSRAIGQRTELVDRLRTTMPPGEFDAAVAALCAPAKQVVVSGGYFSRHLAVILAAQLDQLLPQVVHAHEPLGQDIGRILGLGKDGVLIMLDLRRHELPARQVVELARRRGATVVVVTDEELSPAADIADIVLPVAVDGVPFDSFAGLMTLVEVLVEAVFQRLGEVALDRMREWEESVQITRAFRVGAAGALATTSPAAELRQPVPVTPGAP